MWRGRSPLPPPPLNGGTGTELFTHCTVPDAANAFKSSTNFGTTTNGFHSQSVLWDQTRMLPKPCDPLEGLGECRRVRHMGNQSAVRHQIACGLSSLFSSLSSCTDCRVPGGSAAAAGRRGWHAGGDRERSRASCAGACLASTLSPVIMLNSTVREQTVIRQHFSGDFSLCWSASFQQELRNDPSSTHTPSPPPPPLLRVIKARHVGDRESWRGSI